MREELVKHLSPLEREGIITAWHDRRITGGTEWAGAIDNHLRTAHVILLLVSSDFLASHYCYDVEMRHAIDRHRGGNARVVPIILRPVDWENAPFGKLQPLPIGGRPVTTWANQDEAFRDIVKGIRSIASQIEQYYNPSEVDLSSIESSLSALCSGDPLMCLAVAETLPASKNTLAQIIRQTQLAGFPTTEAAAQRVINKNPREAAPLLMQALFLGWHEAYAASRLFTPAVGVLCYRELQDHLKSWSHDLLRVTIEAIGRTGPWFLSADVVDVLQNRDEDSFGKLSPFAIRALLRMFVMTRDAAQCRYVSHYVLAVLRLFAEENCTVAINNIDILSHCSGIHVDEMLKTWLYGDVPLATELACIAFGACRMTRTVKPLSDLLYDSRQTYEVTRQASIALGSIGNNEAVNVLQTLSLTANRGASYGVVFCLHKFSDDVLYARNVQSDLSARDSWRWYDLRAIGIRRDHRFLAEVREAVYGEDPIVRGAATLALARLTGRDEIGRIKDVFREAATPEEVVLTALALIMVAPDGCTDVQMALREALPRSWIYLRDIAFRSDVIQVLATGSPSMVELARA